MVKMVAHLYDDMDWVRIFVEENYFALMDCHINLEDQINKKGAEKTLNQCRLYRVGKWYKREWGYECKVSWSKPK